MARGRKGFGLEWAEWLVFPGLNVPCGPIVEQHIAKDHLVSLRDRDRMPQRGTCPYNRAHFQFNI